MLSHGDRRANGSYNILNYCITDIYWTIPYNHSKDNQFGQTASPFKNLYYFPEKHPKRGNYKGSSLHTNDKSL